VHESRRFDASFSVNLRMNLPYEVDAISVRLNARIRSGGSGNN